jgi:hypothetical protein
MFQRMVDSFKIDTGSNSPGSSTTQVQGSDRSREDNNGNGNCDRISHPDPDVGIPPYPPDLNCPDISNKNFKVIGIDPHDFDRDNDGIGCESAENEQPLTICTMEISYGQGPCDEYYIPPDENGQRPEGHRFIEDQDK